MVDNRRQVQYSKIWDKMAEEAREKVLTQAAFIKNKVNQR
jgi:hypothetical protein